MSEFNFKIVLVSCAPVHDSNLCRYRVFTNDGGCSTFLGFDTLPEMVKKFISSRNDSKHVFQGGICISSDDLPEVV